MKLSEAKHVHFVGIGGIGLSAIARVLLARGLRVTGSDPAPSLITADLEREGARIQSRHRPENVTSDTDLVVISSAVSAENPEVRAAQAKGVAVVKRREILGQLTEGYRTIAIAGSHGKTTTTALVGLMLVEAGFDPTVIVGGIVPEFRSNARVGKSDYFVIEADEYDNAFMGLSPCIGLITNVDYDHPDIFPTRADYQLAFGELARRVRPDGLLIVCGDDEGASSVASRSHAKVLSYGLDKKDNWNAKGVESNEVGGSTFTIMKGDVPFGEVRTRIPGRHNVLNAIGATAVAASAGVPFDAARSMLGRYQGVGRRFQVRGEFGGITIVDDYAHHPSEIRATLAAARERYPGRKLWVVFQPHTYTRTRALLDDFAGAFDAADCVVITAIYAAREHDTLGLSGMDLVTSMTHRDVRFVATLDGAADYITRRVSPGAVVITMGAGDVWRAGERLAELADVERRRT